ncbi:hypothetical protein Tco_0991076 [Tanacetum coccineum]|uniref:Uncharacterized protein n=1 Tax=Tanacetum coccineum TaxID=301880 RepID=A0ABQ5EZY1_9ASTR
MPYQWKGLRNYESFISSPPAIRTCLRMLLQAGVLLSMGARITLDVFDFTGRCMSQNLVGGISGRRIEDDGGDDGKLEKERRTGSEDLGGLTLADLLINGADTSSERRLK